HLAALGGHDVGEKNDPVRLSADFFTGAGRNVYIFNDRSLALGNVTAQNELVIGAAGGVATLGGTLTANRLEIDAKGDVNVDIDASSLLIRGGNITVANHSPHLNIEGIAGGDIGIAADGSAGTDPAGAGIRGKNLAITAAGDIGSQTHPLAVLIAGIVQATSVYGKVYIRRIADEDDGAHYYHRVLTDKETGIRVEGGRIHAATELRVREMDLEGDSELARMIRAAIERHKLLAGYDIELYAYGAEPYRGKIMITIPVDRKYEGRTVYVLYENEEGETVIVKCVVRDGKVAFEAERFVSPVAVTLPMAGLPQTGGAELPFAWLLLAAGALLLLFTLRRRKN
ncbi:MAG TPA: hypothetical protein PK438_04420, partial [Clostridia bacterium]|nr:hypothetical protein [Clostridia bacterium]